MNLHSFNAVLGSDIENTKCKFATVGHLYSITEKPKILKKL